MSVYNKHGASQMALVVKTLPANAGDVRDAGWIPGSGRSSEEHGSPLQYSHWEGLTDRGPWWATVHEVTKSWTQLNRLSMHTISIFAFGAYWKN